MKIEQAIAGLGLTLPVAAPPTTALLVPAVRSGNLVFVSGNTGGSANPHRGKLGTDLTVEQGAEAAKFAILGCLASAKTVIEDLDRVDRIVKLLGFVNVAEGFTEMPQVVNGASQLLLDLFGESGQHARSAIGVASLPGNAPVEIEMVLAVR